MFEKLWQNRGKITEKVAYILLDTKYSYETLSDNIHVSSGICKLFAGYLVSCYGDDFP